METTYTTEKTRIQAAYKSAANVYHAGAGGDYQRTSARHLLVNLNPAPAPGDAVLDLGCGTGIALFVLLELYPQIGKAVGLDLSAQMLEKASEEAAGLSHPITWIEGDAHHLPFEDNSFNLLISHNAFHWMPDRARVLKEIKRVLAPGGRLALLFEGAGAREGQMSVRRKVLQKYGLTPPVGYGTGQTGETAWNSLGSVETLFEEAGFEIVEAWGRQSYQYIPVAALMGMFRSTASYWQAGLSQEQTELILEEIRSELIARSTERGFREILYPVNIIAARPQG